MPPVLRLPLSLSFVEALFWYLQHCQLDLLLNFGDAMKDQAATVSPEDACFGSARIVLKRVFPCYQFNALDFSRAPDSIEESMRRLIAVRQNLTARGQQH